MDRLEYIIRWGVQDRKSLNGTAIDININCLLTKIFSIQSIVSIASYGICNAKVTKWDEIIERVTDRIDMFSKYFYKYKSPFLQIPMHRRSRKYWHFSSPAGRFSNKNQQWMSLASLEIFTTILHKIVIRARSYRWCISLFWWCTCLFQDEMTTLWNFWTSCHAMPCTWHCTDNTYFQDAMLCHTYSTMLLYIFKTWTLRHAMCWNWETGAKESSEMYCKIQQMTGSKLLGGKYSKKMAGKRRWSFPR